MTHDGQNPSAQTGPLTEEVARAQSSLAGVLHQIYGLLPIASELMGVATENRELSYQIGIKGRASVRFWPSNRCRRERPAPKPKFQPGCGDGHSGAPAANYRGHIHCRSLGPGRAT